MKKLSILALSVFILSITTVTAQPDFDNVEIKVIPAAGDIYMLEGYGGNIGVSVGDDGILMIDDQFAPLADKIKAALKGLNQGKLKFILNTHVHGDHVGGNSIFGKETTIIAHQNIRKRMVDDFNNKEENAQGSVGWPVITFESSLSVHFNSEEIEVIHMPVGYTDGDAVVYFKSSNVLHTGDHLFNGMFPFIDLESGGTVDGYIKNVELIISKLNDSMVIIPGHGPLANGDDFDKFLDMLKNTTKIVKDHITDGKSSDEIVALGLGDKWEDWSWAFIPTKRWIETIYNDYTK